MMGQWDGRPIFTLPLQALKGIDPIAGNISFSGTKFLQNCLYNRCRVGEAGRCRAGQGGSGRTADEYQRGDDMHTQFAFWR
jgi:hypothetical protein